MNGPIASVIVPAHDEEAVIERTLRALTTGAGPDELDVVVVCNGCTDRTAELARAFAGVRVVETPVPSKRAALRLGDDATTAFPRLYVDADVEIDVPSVRMLVETLRSPSVLSCAPERRLARQGVRHLVARYYDVWEKLPQVREGLFGRGVVAVSREGYERIAALPPVMSDDLVMSEAFSPTERRVVRDAVAVVHPARTMRALLARRVRVATGTAQAQDAKLSSNGARTSVRGLLALAAADRTVAAGLPVFLFVTVAARTRSARRIRAGDYDTWQRDTSSRST